jgi:hypothetical protein
MKMIVFSFKNALAYYSAGVVAVNIKAVGLDPTIVTMIVPVNIHSAQTLKTSVS